MRALERGPLLVLLGALFFSTTGLAQSQAPEGATPYVIGGLRMVMGGIALWLWCQFRGLSPRAYHWPARNLVPAVIALTAFQLCFFKGLLLAGVAVGTVVAIGFTPIVVAVLGWFVLRERPAKLWYPATALALTGLVLLNSGGDGPINPASILLPLMAGFCYASYLVFSKPLCQTIPAELVMMVVCLLCGLCLIPVFFLFPIDWIFSPRGMAVAVFLGVISTAASFSFTLAGFRTTPAAVASTLCLAEPLGAAVFGVFLLHETIAPLGLLGMAAILAGVLLLVRGALHQKGC